MKFQYEDVQTSNKFGYRWYHSEQGAYPSITSVLGGSRSAEASASLQSWRDSMGHERADEVSRAACDSGTNVHLLAERMFKGEEILAPINGQPVPRADVERFNALKFKLRKVTEVWGQEVPLVSHRLGVAGRCDLVGCYSGVPSILDFKTASRIKGRDDIGDYFLQLAFYGAAHNEMFGTSIQQGVILMTASTGFPLEFRTNLSEHTDELQKRIDEFWRRLVNTAELIGETND